MWGAEGSTRSQAEETSSTCGTMPTPTEQAALRPINYKFKRILSLFISDSHDSVRFRRDEVVIMQVWVANGTASIGLHDPQSLVWFDRCSFVQPRKAIATMVCMYVQSRPKSTGHFHFRFSLFTIWCALVTHYTVQDCGWVVLPES